MNFEGNGAISKVAKNLLELKNTKTHANNTSSAIVPEVHSCADSTTILGHVNAELLQNRLDYIVTCLHSQYQQLGRNIPPESHHLFGDDVTQRVMTITAKKLLLHKNLYKSAKTFNNSLETLGIVLHNYQNRKQNRQNFSKSATHNNYNNFKSFKHKKN